MPEWFEDEGFWQAHYPYMFSEKRREAALEEVDQILSLIEIEPNKVLDLCCGPGRHAIAFAKKGLTVTGVDGSPFLLEKAREFNRNAKTEVEFVEMDMREFVRLNSFDLVVNLFTSFGYFENPDDDVTVARQICASLKPGGVLCMDLLGKEVLARMFQSTTSTLHDDGTLLIYRHEIFADWTRVRNKRIIIKKHQTQVFDFCHTLYSGKELKDLLFSAGFSQVKLYGELTGAEYGLNSKRLIAVATK